ncbi:MAG TPA: prolipoprotein diacylglyceryl transferase [Cyclobacteriaceae bacterium]|nr:prolipoprotein diacylglyceryl transferase [Cyclobacteriaceae bacterium]
MHPILFEIGEVAVYSYGFMIAIGVIGGVSYMAIRGKKEIGLSFDLANSLFLYIFAAAFIGGKVFLFFENPSYYSHQPEQLFTGRGFVFYGSFLFTIPTMFWFFKKHKLPVYQMLDIMAITTCIVHVFGRIGCFMAGCCYGKPTDSLFGITFTDPACHANPLNTPLHPTQLYEAFFILSVMIFLLYVRDRKTFHGQLFLLYMLLYGAGRFLLEYFRGDIERGFIIKNLLSHSQLIAIMIIGVVLMIYFRWSKRNRLALK